MAQLYHSTVFRYYFCNVKQASYNADICLLMRSSNTSLYFKLVPLFFLLLVKPSVVAMAITLMEHSTFTQYVSKSVI